MLLGGNLTVTPRLKTQIEGSRFIAADSGMMHAAALRVMPELWVGDFDSAGSELTIQYRDVPRQSFPAEKDATDGALAVAEAIRRGADDLILLGGLGGQTDHTTGLLGQSLRIARQGLRCLLTSGAEEAYPLLAGDCLLDLAPGTRLSLIPFANFAGLDLDGGEMAAPEPLRAAGLDAHPFQCRHRTRDSFAPLRLWHRHRLSPAWQR